MLNKIGEITPPCFTPLATVKCVELYNILVVAHSTAF